MNNLVKNYDYALINYGYAQGDIGDFHAAFNDSGAMIRDIILATDTEAQNTASTELSQTNAKIDTYFANMKKSMINQSELKYYNEINDNLPKYKAIRDQVIALAGQNKSAEAQTLLLKQGDPIAYAISASIESLDSEKTTIGHQLSADLDTQTQVGTIATILLIIGALITSSLIALSISRSISKPINEMAAVAESLAAGELDVTITYSSKNEIGSLANSLKSATNTLKLYVYDISTNLGLMAQGDMTVDITQQYIGSFIPIKQALVKISESLNQTLTQINQASEQVSVGSEQVSDGAQTSAQGATEQASSIEELSASITEISTQVKDNATHAAEANKNASIANSELGASNQHMDEMIVAMTQINDSSSKIGKIIKTIEDIAFQTNILALNAAVEAARAGAAGKGFAVVADEVRNLASKSAEAAKNTTDLIENSMKQVENGTKIADETAKALLRVVEGAKVVSDTVEKISEASNWSTIIKVQ